MCDFDEGDYMEEDSFEDEWESETDDLDNDFTDDPRTEDADLDEFTARDAFFIGSIVGNAYEEGLDEQKRRRLLKKKRARRDRTSD